MPTLDYTEPAATYLYTMQRQICLHCGLPVMMIHVHGHYQCPTCGNNALPCCDGDNCDTNLLMASANEIRRKDEVVSDASIASTAGVQRNDLPI